MYLCEEMDICCILNLICRFETVVIVGDNSAHMDRYTPVYTPRKHLRVCVTLGKICDAIHDSNYPKSLGLKMLLCFSLCGSRCGLNSVPKQLW